MRILLPISLDRWRNPISTLLRACVEANPSIEFHSVSNPHSEEDRELGEQFWKLPNIVSASQVRLIATRFDLVHTASITAHNQAAVVAAKLRNPGRCQYLGTINLQVGPMDGKDWHLLKTAEKLADGFVSVSRAAGEGVASRCRDRFMGVIPNGFDPAYFDPEIEDEIILPAAVRKLEPGSFPLYIGALEPRKHPEFVVELARRHPEITFVAAGYVHPLGHHFVPLIKSLPNLLWLGHVDRRMIRALLHRSGVFLFPSEREGLPLSVIEALGMGLPVIGQPKTSMPELIVHGENGYLLDISEPELWSAHLIELLSRPTGILTCSPQEIRQSAVSRFSWASIGNSYGGLYHQLTSC
jgi:glycosyltransferase involved in cell wall biosynthesis